MKQLDEMHQLISVSGNERATQELLTKSVSSS